MHFQALTDDQMFGTYPAGCERWGKPGPGDEQFVVGVEFFWPHLPAVDRYQWPVANSVSLARVRQVPPAAGCAILTGPRSRSAWLFGHGTAKSVVNRRVMSR